METYQGIAATLSCLVIVALAMITGETIKGIAAGVLFFVGAQILINLNNEMEQKDKVYAQYEGGTSEQQFAANQYKHCMSSAGPLSNKSSVDCRVSVTELAGQLQGKEFKAAVATSLARLDVDLNR